MRDPICDKSQTMDLSLVFIVQLFVLSVERLQIPVDDSLVV